MAQFYQEPNPINDPNYLGQSKEPDRQQADTSLGGLFEGIGGIVSKAGPTIEAGFKERIKEDARKLIDPIQAEHGTDLTGDQIKYIAGTGAKGRVRALQMQNGAGLAAEDGSVSGFAPEDKPDVTAGGIFPDDKAKPLPPAADKEINQLKRMSDAYNAGTLSDSYYNGQLLSVVSKLKARYPGWQDEIDSSVSQITGIQPANALRASLNRDIQYNQAAQLAGQTSYQKYIEKNEGIINALGLDPKKHPEDTVRAGVADWKGGTAILEAKQLRATVGSPEAEATLSDTIAAQVQSFITQKTNQAQGGKSFSDFQADAQRMTLAGGGTPKEVNAFVNGLTLQRADLEAKIRADIYKPIENRKDGHNLVTLTQGGDQKLSTILTTQLKPIDDMIALAKAGNMSALQASTDAIKYQSNQDVMNLNRSFPQARVAASINTVFPNNPIMANRFIETSSILPDWQKAIKNGVGNAILGGTAASPAPTPSEAVKLYGPDAEKSGAVYKETIKQYNLVISQENKNTDNSVHVAKQFFGDQSFYDNLNDSGRLKLFMTMASPDKTKFIDKLAESDPEIKEKYKQWTQHAAGDIWRRNSDTLQSFLTSKNFDIQYNAGTGLFEDHTKYTGLGDRGRGQQPQIVNSSIQSVNNAITLMKPIVGNKPEELLNSLGVNPHADKEDGFVTKMFNALGDKLQDWRSSGTREDVKSGRQGLEPHQTRGVIKGNLSDNPDGIVRVNPISYKTDSESPFLKSLQPLEYGTPAELYKAYRDRGATHEEARELILKSLIHPGGSEEGDTLEGADETMKKQDMI